MLERKKDYHAWLYLVIPIFLMSIFTLYPLFKTFFVAFNNYDPIAVTNGGFGDKWGFFNFVGVFSHQPFITTIGNTLLVVFVSVPLSTIVALLLAVALNSIKPLQKIFQTIFFLPYVTNSIAIGMVFAVIFNRDHGLITSLTGQIYNWINPGTVEYPKDYVSRMLVLQVYLLWNNLAFKILVFIGGLQNISKQYYDAAKIDATPKYRVFTKITIPLLSPMIVYILITSFIGAFKTYDAVIGIFGSDWTNNQDMQTIVGFVYEMVKRGVLEDYTYAYGAAASIVLFLIIMVFTGINLFISNKRVHY